MKAVVELGSQQYTVAQGDVITAQRLDGKENKEITLNKILVFENGKDIRVGQPYLKDVKISAKVIAQPSQKKVVSFKYRRRKSSAWKKGHRQKVTALKITKITAGQ